MWGASTSTYPENLASGGQLPAELRGRVSLFCVFVRHAKMLGTESYRRCIYALHLGGTGISPQDSFSYRSNFRFRSSFRSRSHSSSCCTTSGDIFYCSGSRQLNHSSLNVQQHQQHHYMQHGRPFVQSVTVTELSDRLFRPSLKGRRFGSRPGECRRLWCRLSTLLRGYTHGHRPRGRSPAGTVQRWASRYTTLLICPGTRQNRTRTSKQLPSTTGCSNQLSLLLSARWEIISTLPNIGQTVKHQAANWGGGVSTNCTAGYTVIVSNNWLYF